MSRSESFAVAAFLAAVAMALSLRWWLPIDEAVYRWIQFHRSCAIEGIGRGIDPTVRVVLVLLLVVSFGREGWRRPGALTRLILLFLVGAGFVELAKTAIERLRPNSIPAMVSGNSFPSGHTAGAMMAAAIAMVLAHSRAWPALARWSVYVTAGLCVALQGLGRLLNGSHWVTDVVVSILFGTAWVLGAGLAKRAPRSIVAACLAVGVVAFAAFDDVPNLRVRLPAAIDEARSSLASIEFGTDDSRGALVGKWSDGPTEPIGPTSWALAADVGLLLRVREAPLGGTLKMTLRPNTGPGNRRSCARVVISINDWSAHEITLARGWREYHVEPPLGVIHRGDNTIRFHIVVEEGEPSFGLAGFRYLRLFPKA